jgi:hypothetical protein
MDVDAGERRPGGGRRRGHAQHRSRAGADRRPVMEKRTELHAIQEPEAPAASNVFQINAIRSYFHGLATPRPLGAPWPRQVVWHDVPKIGL